jgi:hypothetical protein
VSACLVRIAQRSAARIAVLEHPETLEQAGQQDSCSARPRRACVQPAAVAMIGPTQLVCQVVEPRFASDSGRVDLEPSAQAGIREEPLDQPYVVRWSQSFLRTRSISGGATSASAGRRTATHREPMTTSAMGRETSRVRSVL